MVTLNFDKEKPLKLEVRKQLFKNEGNVRDATYFYSGVRQCNKCLRQIKTPYETEGVPNHECIEVKLPTNPLERNREIARYGDLEALEPTE